MASGDVAAIVCGISYPGGANAGVPDVRPSSSSPAENWPVVKLDNSADTYVDFLCYCLSAVNMTVNLTFSLASATTGNVEFEISFHAPGTSEDIDSSHTFVYQASGSVSVPGTSGVLKETTVPLTTAQQDGLAANDYFLMRVRNNSGVSSPASGDIELLCPPIIKET